jgi:hypothetical protein
MAAMGKYHLSNLPFYEKEGESMKAKGVLVILVVLALVFSVPVSSHASGPYNYGKIWTAYPEKDPLWNIYQGGSPIEWFPWANNYRFSIFTVVWPGSDNMDIVLDHATGLVWQRRPLNLNPLLTWAEAQFGCTAMMAGSGYFMGWRLPQVQELLSLVDYFNGADVLPAGHPFIIGNKFTFWSATPDPRDTFGSALYVDFSERNQPLKSANKKGDVMNVWCVRGGAPPGGC